MVIVEVVMSDEEWKSDLISMLRKHLPTSLAEEMSDLQPINLTNPIFTMKGDRVGFKNFTLATNQHECENYSGTHYAVDVRPLVAEWLKTQPSHMWRPAGDTRGCQITCSRYIISQELLTWLTLRWS